MPSRGSVKPERIGRGLLWAGGMALVAWPLAVAGWSFAIEQSSVGMALPDIRSGGWEVTGSRADVRPSVTANGDVATIDFAPSSLVLTKHLTFVGADQPLTLNNLRTDLSNTTVTLYYGANGPWAQRISIDGDISIERFPSFVCDFNDNWVARVILTCCHNIKDE